MKFRFIKQEQRWYSVDDLCRAMDVTRGGYWSWAERSPHMGRKTLRRMRVGDTTTVVHCAAEFCGPFRPEKLLHPRVFAWN